jgi:hypothetical protein
MEAVEFGPTFSFLFALFSRAKVSHDLKGRTPTLELNLPVHQDSRGHYDQMWTPYTLLNG